MKKFIIFILLVLIGLFCYARFLEPQNFKINEYQITSTSLPTSFDGTKIVHFSDVKYKDDITMLEKAVTNINKENPDIVVFTGDLLFNKISEKEKDNIIKQLTNIKSKEYKYAILGDKDGNTARDILTQSNFIILDNSSEYIFKNSETPILIAGGTDITDELLEKDITIDNDFKIALIHKPDDYEAIKDKNISLVLAGHSLGGDIIIPFWGNLIKRDGAKTYITPNYKNLYVSYGIGTSKYNMRLFNKPSINVYRLNTK